MDRRLLQIGLTIVPLVLALAVTALLIVLLESDPIRVAETAWAGAFADTRRIASVFNFWIPLVLAGMGLAVTFTAGLWNIGIEGQIVMGAIFASWGAQFIDLPNMALIPVCVALAMLGGMLWALLAGLLKTRFGVHEIFGGVALNFIALNFAIYLISGPWQPPEGGSAQATPPFPAQARLGYPSSDFQVNLFFLALVAIAIVGIALMLRGTRWGLMLKATGKNARSALLLGVPTERVSLSAFVVCGMLAGIAGAHRVLHTYSSLRPSPAGGIGFLALLVVLLVAYRAWWVPFVAFALAAVIAGSTRVKILLQLDQSLAGVLQGMIVLMILLFNGVKARLLPPPKNHVDEPPPPVRTQSSAETETHRT